MPNSHTKFFFGHSDPNILGPTPKFKIPHPRLFSPGPKVYLCRTKTQGGDRFSRNRPFSAQGCTLEVS